MTRGATVAAARKLILALPEVTEGRSYGMPSFLLAGKFFARFRDGDTVLALQIGSIDERDVLMGLDPEVFFFTEHYRNYPVVLIRLARIPRPLLADVVTVAWTELAAKRRAGSKSEVARGARAAKTRTARGRTGQGSRRG